MRVRALKAAPDTAGLYFLMKGFALHPFGEGERGNSQINCNLNFIFISKKTDGTYTVGIFFFT